MTDLFKIVKAYSTDNTFQLLNFEAGRPFQNKKCRELLQKGYSMGKKISADSLNNKEFKMVWLN